MLPDWNPEERPPVHRTAKFHPPSSVTALCSGWASRYRLAPVEAALVASFKGLGHRNPEITRPDMVKPQRTGIG